MTTLPLSGAVLRYPTRKELRDMLNRPAVAVAAIVAGLIAFLAILGGVVFLAYTNHSTEAVTGLLGGSLLVLVMNLRSKVNELHSEVKQQSGGG